MIRVRRHVHVSLIGLGLLALAACGTAPAAQVNGEVITQAEYSRDLHGILDYLTISEGVDWEVDPRAQAVLPELRGSVLEGMIATRLLRQQAEAEGIVISEQAIDERIAQLIEARGGRAAFVAWLETLGLDGMELRRYVADMLLRDQMIERHAPAPATEIEARRVRHVLVGTREEAEAARARLAAGESWETVAAEVSLDPGTKGAGGELGYVLPGQTVPGFDQAVFAAPPNELSGVVQTQYGYHIVQVTEVRRQPASPAQMREEQEVALDRYLNEVRQRSAVTTHLAEASAGGSRP
jgi:parvulin-like peptidyl-prolyl isomerase